MEGKSVDELKYTNRTEAEKVEMYYDTLLKQGSAELSPDIVAYLILVISMLLLFIPVQELFSEGKDNELLFIVWVFMLLTSMAVHFYMQKYHAVVGGKNKIENVAEKMRYLPIHHKVRRNYLLRILVRILLKITIAGLIIQSGMALIAYHQISIWNIVYVLVMTFFVPMLFCGGSIFVAK